MRRRFFPEFFVIANINESLKWINSSINRNFLSYHSKEAFIDIAKTFNFLLTRRKAKKKKAIKGDKTHFVLMRALRLTG